MVALIFSFELVASVLLKAVSMPLRILPFVGPPVAHGSRIWPHWSVAIVWMMQSVVVKR